MAGAVSCEGLYWVEKRLVRKKTPLFWWQTTPCEFKKTTSQFVKTVRILPFAKHVRACNTRRISHCNKNQSFVWDDH